MSTTMYTGNCHCGLFQYTIALPPQGLTSLELIYCDCSICFKKGYLFATIPFPSPLIVTKGAGTEGGFGKGVMSSYSFGSKQFDHRFCGECGTPLGIVPMDGCDRKNIVQMWLNIRTIQGLDVWKLEENAKLVGTLPTDGYKVPEFPPDSLTELESQIDKEAGEMVYTGSCHCGGITYGLQTKPLEEKANGVEVKECHCSSCVRYATIFTYPRPRTRLSISDPTSKLKSYTYPLGRKFQSYQFCSVCGVMMFIDVKGPPKEVVERQKEEVKEMIKKNCDIIPTNIRTLTFCLFDKEQLRRVKSRVERERGDDGREYIVPNSD